MGSSTMAPASCTAGLWPAPNSVSQQSGLPSSPCTLSPLFLSMQCAGLIHNVRACVQAFCQVMHTWLHWQQPTTTHPEVGSGSQEVLLLIMVPGITVLMMLVMMTLMTVMIGSQHMLQCLVPFTMSRRGY